MSQSKKQKGKIQILNCQQNYLEGELISAISLSDITPESKLARKAKKEANRKDVGTSR